MGALAAYVSPSTVTSLLSSIAQTLLTDRNPGVREAALKSLSIAWTYVETPEKYSAGLNVLLENTVNAPSPVSQIAFDVFLPTFSLWTLNQDGLFQTFVEGLLERVRQKCAELPPIPAAKSVYLENNSGSLGVENVKSFSSSSSRSPESVWKAESEILPLIKILARLTLFALLHVSDDLSIDEERKSGISDNSASFSTTSKSLFEVSTIYGSGSSALHQIARKITHFRALKKDDFNSDSTHSATTATSPAALTSIRWLIQFARQLVSLTKTIHPLRSRILSGLASLFYRLRCALGDEFVRLYVLSGWHKHREDEEEPHELLIPYDLGVVHFLSRQNFILARL